MFKSVPTFPTYPTNPNSDNTADIRSATDYYAFGWEKPGRSFSGDGYAYGMNTQLKDYDYTPGTYSAMFWEYDSRVGQRRERDPKPTVGVSDNAVFGGNPVANMDKNGDFVQFLPVAAVVAEAAAPIIIAVVAVVVVKNIIDGKPIFTIPRNLFGKDAKEEDNVRPLLPPKVIPSTPSGMDANEGSNSSPYGMDAKDLEKVKNIDAEHKKNARPSTTGVHEKGRARVKRDRGGEAGDINRRPPNKKPNGYKGPWPPKK